MSDDPGSESAVERGDLDSALLAASLASTYKVRGKFESDTGAAVLGYNTAGSGTPVGVQGVVDDPAGFGLETPDDARIDGDIEATSGHTLTVDGVPNLRLGPQGTDQFNNVAGGNVVGGWKGNSAGDAVGATIGGGGSGPSLENRVTDNYGTVSGGKDNQAGDAQSGTDNAVYATVAGGKDNTASATKATVGGGEFNTASGRWNTIAGGQNNNASKDFATVGGGNKNKAVTRASTVAGGDSNNAFGNESAIGGGINNRTGTSGSGSADHATISGGRDNLATADHATVSGGTSNTATNLNATVAGGELNNAYGGGDAIGGGANNRTATSGTLGSTYATVAGGEKNTAGDEGATVSGGTDNSATSGARYATVGGGTSNVAKGQYATVPGGRENDARKDDSFSAGRKAIADHQGAFVVGDSSSTQVKSSGTDEVVFQAGGGFFIQGIGSGSSGTSVLWDSGELILDTSSARYKTNVRPLDADPGAAMDLEAKRFEYEGSGEEDVGFIAEEVAEDLPELVVRDEEDRPDSVRYDRLGVFLLPAVRELRRRLSDVEDRLDDAGEDRLDRLETELRRKDDLIDDQNDRIDSLEAENDHLRERNATLERRLAAVESELGLLADPEPAPGDD